jgi:hypothetical protein
MSPPSTTALVPLPHLRCPLCGEENDCAAARTGSFDAPCWCREIVIALDTLARVPEAQRNRACLCKRCAGALNTAI